MASTAALPAPEGLPAAAGALGAAGATAVSPWPGGGGIVGGATSTPIAGGECLTAAYEWRVFAQQDSFDIGQPDASFTGGLSEFLAVAKMMEQRDRKVATHAWGAGGSLASLNAGSVAESG